jgi:hypothetical protein
MIAIFMTMPMPGARAEVFAGAAAGIALLMSSPAGRLKDHVRDARSIESERGA